jgi:hypothetical protein
MPPDPLSSNEPTLMNRLMPSSSHRGASSLPPISSRKRRNRNPPPDGCSPAGTPGVPGVAVLRSGWPAPGKIEMPPLKAR